MAVVHGASRLQRVKSGLKFEAAPWISVQTAEQWLKGSEQKSIRGYGEENRSYWKMKPIEQKFPRGIFHLHAATINKRPGIREREVTNQKSVDRLVNEPQEKPV